MLLYGGLGNQLFKLFAASRLIEDGVASSVSIDVSWYKYKGPESSSAAEYQLSRIIDGLQFIETTIKPKKIYSLTQEILTRLTPNQQTRFGIYNDVGNYLRPDFCPKMMVGDFENISFFPSEAKMISIFEQLTIQNSWVFKIASEIKKISPIIVHVRLEDYIKNSDIYGIVDIDYYLKAVSHFRSQNPSCPIWLISDNLPLAVKRFQGLLDFDYVLKQPVEVSPLQFLSAISSTNKIIIANSTFSWWAAWLAHRKNNEVQVVMPSRFHSYENNIDRLYISGWKRIPV